MEAMLGVNTGHFWGKDIAKMHRYCQSRQREPGFSIAATPGKKIKEENVESGKPCQRSSAALLQSEPGVSGPS